MKKYDVIDKQSGIVISIYNSDYIESLSKELGENVSSLFSKINIQMQSMELKYILDNNYNIIPVPINFSMINTFNKSFTNYQEALDYKNNQK